MPVADAVDVIMWLLPQDRKRYEALRQKLRRSRGHLQKPEGEIEMTPADDVDTKSPGHLAPST